MPHTVQFNDVVKLPACQDALKEGRRIAKCTSCTNVALYARTRYVLIDIRVRDFRQFEVS